METRPRGTPLYGAQTKSYSVRLCGSHDSRSPYGGNDYGNLAVAIRCADAEDKESLATRSTEYSACNT